MLRQGEFQSSNRDGVSKGRALGPSPGEFPREALNRRGKQLNQGLEIEGSDD